MKIYKAELEAGLSDNIQRSCATVIAPVENRSFSQEDADLINELLSVIRKEKSSGQSIKELTGSDNPDLALVVSILVSAGWNLNDDIFIPSELWKARHTPKHKPLNDEHDDTRIYGHIIDSRAIDKNGNEIVIEEDENIPNEFDVETTSVLYKALPSLSSRIEEIIDSAKNNTMFVSMEAWFNDFAYGVLDDNDNVTRVIARNEETAFLTKHLRIFRGTGEFKGHRIGRVLLNINFGGQAFTETPANPESVIKVAARKAVASKCFEKGQLGDFTRGGVNVDLETLKKELEAAKSAIKDRDKTISELSGQLEDFKAKDTGEKIDDLSGQVDSLTKQLSEANEKLEEANTVKDELEAKVEEISKEADGAKSKLAEIEKKSKAKDRLAKLKEVKDIEDEKATLAEIADWSDETFDSVMKYASKTKAEENKEAKNNEEDNDKETEKAEAALDNVETDDNEPNMSVQPEDETDKESKLALATANALFGQDDDEGGEN